tara:strand:+ start:177 stop:428 length:252 start_codon:yes stop_codon:yes gene_type:complete
MSDNSLLAVMIISVCLAFPALDFTNNYSARQSELQAANIKMQAYALETERKALEVEILRLRAAEIGYADMLINKYGEVYEVKK